MKHWIELAVSLSLDVVCSLNWGNILVKCSIRTSNYNWNCPIALQYSCFWFNTKDIMLSNTPNTTWSQIKPIWSTILNFFDKLLELVLKINRYPQKVLEVLKNDLTLEIFSARIGKLSNFLTQDELKEVVLGPKELSKVDSNTWDESAKIISWRLIRSLRWKWHSILFWSTSGEKIYDKRIRSYRDSNSDCWIQSPKW